MSVNNNNAWDLVLADKRAAYDARLATLAANFDFDQFVKVSVYATFNLFGFDAKVLYLFGRIDIVDVIRDLAEIAALNGVSQR